jgi:YbbR domain-containing protein
MTHIFTRDLGWKLLSLVIAIALWIAIAREPEVATAFSAPVDFKNMRDDLDIRGNLPDRVRLEVRGPSGRLTRDDLAGVAVVLDLADAAPGERTYSIRGRNLNLPPGVVFYRAVPSQLTLDFDQLVYKTEPIQPIYLNKPVGYRVVEQLPLSTVRIRGSSDRVASISLVKTDPMDLRGLSGEKTFHTHLNVGDPQVRIVDAPADMTVQVKLEKLTGGSW